MQPEILHRCPSCGASIRDVAERALFCPECGKTLTNGSGEKSVDLRPEATPEKPAAASAAHSVASAPDAKAEVGETKAKVDAGDKSPGDQPQGARERTRGTLQRASSMARGAVKDNVKRVEKIHHVSTVLLEEATYDPSLRFVLVAVALFVVFVILLILTKVMG